MSKGKELLYSFNRSFEKFKLLFFPDLPGEITDIFLSVAPVRYKIAKDRCRESILSDVSDRELINIYVSTCYSSIEQKLG